EYGMGVCAIGVRVDNARRAFEHAISLGAWAFEGERLGPAELHDFEKDLAGMAFGKGLEKEPRHAVFANLAIDQHMALAQRFQ
ncbi:hypothetical protein AB4Y33_43130, partial [Paraburkholderia sp. BR14319]